MEIGFARLAEMQEEILWLAETAQIPAIWATHVLESFLKTGHSSRGEMTDAAMAARAECVMLNKGPFLFAWIGHLDHLLDRMKGHVDKKAAFCTRFGAGSRRTAVVFVSLANQRLPTGADLAQNTYVALLKAECTKLYRSGRG